MVQWVVPHMAQRDERCIATSAVLPTCTAGDPSPFSTQRGLQPAYRPPLMPPFLPPCSSTSHSGEVARKAHWTTSKLAGSPPPSSLLFPQPLNSKSMTRPPPIPGPQANAPPLRAAPRCGLRSPRCGSVMCRSAAPHPPPLPGTRRVGSWVPEQLVVPVGLQREGL